MKKILKATLRGLEGYHPTEDSSCILCVSMNQPRQEGEHLAATIHLINNKKFKKCIILICDSLHRINISFFESCSIVQARGKALNLGKEWLNRNQLILNQLTVPFEITHWEDWRGHLEYEEAFCTVHSIYMNDPLVQKSFTESAEDFINRHVKNLIETGHVKSNVDDFIKKARENSIRYLIEEAAIFTILTAKENINFVLYPNIVLAAVKSVHDKLLNPITPHLARWTCYSFRRVIKEMYEEKVFG